MTRQEQLNYIINYFEEKNPDPTTELKHKDPYQLVVSVILSAQCTDKRVNKTTPRFFEQFPNPHDLAQADFDEVQPIIKSITYPNSKAKRLINMAITLVEEFDGEVPDNAKDLQKLPGVGRKSAHVISATLYDAPNLAVDTHVHRVADRLGLTQDATTPLATEKQIVQYVSDKSILPKLHHWLILHGRYTCLARSPKCDQCDLTSVCQYYQENVSKSANKTLN